MAFTYENINDMENIVKATGLTEDELASLIIAKENEGWSNAEIADLLASNFDNKEYAGKAQNELYAMYPLGFKLPKDYNPAGGKHYLQWQEYKEDPSLIDRFKSWFTANKDADEQRNAAARESIAKSVNDWRDSHPEQWRVGMVNAMFGDNSLLSQYYSAKQAAEEAEKNRESQREYNEYLKEYDRKKAEREEAVLKAQEEREKDVKRAELLSKIKDPTIGATEKAIYRKQLEALGDASKQLADEMEKAISEDQVAKEKQQQVDAEKQRKAMNIKAAVLRSINSKKSDKEKAAMLQKFNDAFTKSRNIANVDTNSNDTKALVKLFNFNDFSDYAALSDDDAKEINAKILGFETNEDVLRKNEQNNLVNDVNEQRAKAKRKKELADNARRKRREGHPERVTIEEETAEQEGY